MSCRRPRRWLRLCSSSSKRPYQSDDQGRSLTGDRLDRTYIDQASYSAQRYRIGVLKFVPPWGPPMRIHTDGLRAASV
jgi:hypothetical protein